MGALAEVGRHYRHVCLDLISGLKSDIAARQPCADFVAKVGDLSRRASVGVLRPSLIIRCLEGSASDLSLRALTRKPGGTRRSHGTAHDEHARTLNDSESCPQLRVRKTSDRQDLLAPRDTALAPSGLQTRSLQ